MCCAHRWRAATSVVALHRAAGTPSQFRRKSRLSAQETYGLCCTRRSSSELVVRANDFVLANRLGTRRLGLEGVLSAIEPLDHQGAGVPVDPRPLVGPNECGGGELDPPDAGDQCESVGRNELAFAERFVSAVSWIDLWDRSARRPELDDGVPVVQRQRAEPGAEHLGIESARRARAHVEALQVPDDAESET